MTSGPKKSNLNVSTLNLVWAKGSVGDNLGRLQENSIIGQKGLKSDGEQSSMTKRLHAVGWGRRAFLTPVKAIRVGVEVKKPC